MVAMKYKGRIYSPMVIEFATDPISSPVNVNSRYVEELMPMSLATLTGIDRDDWDGYKKVTL
ncbi:hypothetical protein [Nitrosomonas communis]|uniref:Uncharacterized protein n=1 Tax=Nitrosomonas communis TaxID=44574 RepID=A0A1I4RJ76_9PROT|nr:hypothetical protein [Nitrosomonas communis]SFM52277.1 hypothetical protein SAMN05421863_103324 [Nitrosomonas communis]